MQLRRIIKLGDKHNNNNHKIAAAFSILGQDPLKKKQLNRRFPKKKEA
jgi:hypothetical protein